MIANSTTTRPRCPQCLRALRGCICALVQPVHSDVQVLILQHPLEVHEAKNTARLLHLCLGASSRIEVGETFEPAQLHTLLHAPWHSGDAPRQPVLLYPETPGQASPAARTVAGSPLTPQQQRLIVIDGTWRKTLKMLHANPALQTLPRLPLNITTAGRYRIRKARRADQLSTLEASALALAQMQGWEDGGQALVTLEGAFEGLLELHGSLRIPIVKR